MRFIILCWDDACHVLSTVFKENIVKISYQIFLSQFCCCCCCHRRFLFFLAILPRGKQHHEVQKQRYLEIQQRQELYQWGDDPAYSVDLPGFIKAKDPESLPKDVQLTDEADDTFLQVSQRSLINLGLGDFFNLFDSWDDFDDYRKCFTAFMGDVPIAAAHWLGDSWYGTQFLNGCNPEVIRRCTELPPNFPVTDEIVGDLLEGMTLQDSIEVLHTKAILRQV